MHIIHGVASKMPYKQSLKRGTTDVAIHENQEQEILSNIKNITTMAVNLTNDNAKEFMATELPIVLDFSAAWCGPGKQLAPIIDELSQEYEGRIAVAKCDIEEADDLTMEYGIRNVPTVIFIKDGKVVDKFVGSKSKGEVQAKFEALL